MNLDELKKKLLEALPPALREKMGIHLDEEEEEYDDEVDSDEATANHDLSEMAEGDEDDDGEEDEEDDEEAEKKAKRSKIIRAIAILAVIFFAADEFLNTEEELVVPDAPVVMSPAKKALLEAKKKEAEEAKLAAERAALETPEPTVEPTSEPVVIEDPEFIPEPEPEVPLETAPEILTIEDEPTPAPTPESVVTPDFMENIGQTTPSENVPNPQADQDNSLDALMQAVDKSGKMAEDNMKTQLGRNDPSYVEPPNYLRTGRGLVYNCREGHWACVDKFSYFTCFENQKWNEENVQSAECVTRDVYASGADCAAIQKFYVNKPEPTDFCGKKDIEEVKVESISEPEDLSNLLAP